MPFLFYILAALEQFRAYSAPHALSPRASKNAKEFKLAESLTRFAVPLLLATCDPFAPKLTDVRWGRHHGSDDN